VTGLPTITVKLDDGSLTYPTNVSTRVRLPAGVTVSGYGRTDEQPAAQAAQFSVTLDNTDGAITSTVTVGQGIQFTETIGATTRTRFTGVISAANQGWPTGDDTFSVIQVTAVDPLAALARQPLRSMLEEEILLDNPTAYYTLGEAQGATTAGDTSGNQGVSLSLSNDGGARMTFGQGTGPGVDGLTAAQFAYNGTTTRSTGRPRHGAGFNLGWVVERRVLRVVDARPIQVHRHPDAQLRRHSGAFSWEHPTASPPSQSARSPP
jgi:hypothetical protein